MIGGLDMKYKIGLSCGGAGKELREETFKSCRDVGIEAMEISVDKTKYGEIPYADLKKWSEQYGVRLWSYHMPFSVSMNIDISSVEKEIRDKTVQYFKELIGKASEIGISKFVVHPSCEPIAEEMRTEKIKYSKESLFQLAEYADNCNAVIAVENLPRTCLGRNSKEMLELLSAHEKLRVCFDTNHVLKENVVDFVKNVNEKIVTLHVSDCDFENERHWLPGEGKIDWKSLTTELDKANYNGVWMYEIGFKAPDSIKRERDLTFIDFVENAKMIFH